MLLLGEVWTCDESSPLASAVYAEGGRIIDVGPADDLKARYPGARRYRFERITPGIQDAHVHPVYWGRWLDSLDLRDETDPRRAAARVAEAAARKRPGEWISGGGFVFDHYPDSRLLDAAAPQNPVYLDSRDLHSAWVNRRALEAAGVGPETPDPPGGRILRDGSGRPSGYLLERAVSLVAGRLPPLAKADLVRGLADLAARGYVAVHAMGDSPPEATDWARELAAAGELPLRLAWTLPKEIWRSYAPEKIGQQLHIFGVKYFADGALTSRTAWMLEGYPEGGRGMPLDDPREHDDEMEAVLEAGLVPVWHAIGTRAVRELLNLVDRLDGRGLAARRRFRVEHAQHVAADDVGRLAGLRISMQPLHARDDAQTIKRLFGEAERTSYRWDALARLPGSLLLFGSDAPVAEPDAAAGVAAAASHPLDGKRSLSERDAVRAYTYAPAAALGWSGEDAPWGIVRRGARAALGFWEGGRPVARLLGEEPEPVQS
ncbi:amidohydrolase [Oceanithermus sp.]